MYVSSFDECHQVEKRFFDSSVEDGRAGLETEMNKGETRKREERGWSGVSGIIINWEGPEGCARGRRRRRRRGGRRRRRRGRRRY
jgi:hypothetical protein